MLVVGVVRTGSKQLLTAATDVRTSLPENKPVKSPVTLHSWTRFLDILPVLVPLSKSSTTREVGGLGKTLDTSFPRIRFPLVSRSSGHLTMQG